MCGFAMWQLSHRCRTSASSGTGDQLSFAADQQIQVAVESLIPDPQPATLTPFPRVDSAAIPPTNEPKFRLHTLRSGEDYYTPFSYPYSVEFLATLDVDTRRFALQQQARDAALPVSTPRLAAMNEFVQFPNDTRIEVTIGEWISQGRESTIYGVEDHDELVIKYQANCEGLDGIHPLLRDFWFLKLAHELRVSPEALFVSPPAKFVSQGSPKTRFEMDPYARRRCATRDDSAVRYMVMGRITTTINGIIDVTHKRRQKISLDFDIVVLRSTISQLQRLHEAGIVHNDVHPGNIVVMGTGADSRRIGLIDFGLSFFAAQFSRLPPKVPHIRVARTFCADSVFALDGFRPSFRDDLFGAMLSAAILLNGEPLLRHCLSLQSKRAEMERFKRTEFFFSHGEGPDVIELLEGRSAETKADIRQRLQAALAIVRGIDDIDSLPAYGAILEQLDAIIDLIREATGGGDSVQSIVDESASAVGGISSSVKRLQVTVGDSTS